MGLKAFCVLTLWKEPEYLEGTVNLGQAITSTHEDRFGLMCCISFQCAILVTT